MSQHIFCLTSAATLIKLESKKGKHDQHRTGLVSWIACVMEILLREILTDNVYSRRYSHWFQTVLVIKLCYTAGYQKNPYKEDKSMLSLLKHYFMN